MKNIAVTIPNLIQGVSLQPDPQRDPSQGEIQINGVSSIAEGLRKRDSSRTLAKVSETGFGDAFFHTILRDEKEEYLAVISDDDIKVFDLKGKSVDVTFDAGSKNYLSSVTSAKQDLRAVTVADYTFISNTKTKTAMDFAVAPKTPRPKPHECLVWVKQAVYGNEYKLNLNGIETSVQTPVSAVKTIGTSVLEYRISSEEIADALRRGFEGGSVLTCTNTPVPGTFIGSKTNLPAVFAPPGADGLEIGITGSDGINVRIDGIQSAGSGWQVGDPVNLFAKDINKEGVIKSIGNSFAAGSLDGTKTALMRDLPDGATGQSVVVYGDGKSITAVELSGANATSGWSVGDPIYVQRSDIEAPDVNVRPTVTIEEKVVTTETRQWKEQIGTDDDGNPIYEDREETVVTESTNFKQVPDPDWEGPFDLSVLVQVGTVTDAGFPDSVEDPYEVVQVATVTSVSAKSNSFDIQQSGSVLWVTSDSPITVAAVDAKANATLTAILERIQVFAELPNIAPVGYQINVFGDPQTQFDNYHIEFDPRSGTFGEGEWVETVAPGTEYRLNPSTMPHALVRKQDGTFWFGAVNGQAVAGVPDGVKSWGERIAGDIDTVPDPSFIGYAINDLFVYKNRLGMLSDENVVLSRVREFFEFFPETVTTVLDSDPVDVVASNNRVSVLRYAVPYQDELILFSAQIQYRFNAAETVLTPATAQITALTQFDVDVNIRPQQAGGGIFFLQTNGQWSQMREFAVRGAGTALTADAADLTGYVSSYIPDECFKMAVNDTGNAAFIISEKVVAGGMDPTDYRKRIYVYKWFLRNQGNGVERAQNSWSFWEFGADEVLQVTCIREILYCLMRYGTEVYLEMIPVLDRADEEAVTPYPILLDRLVSSLSVTPVDLRMSKGVYNKQKNQTTFTLPYEATNEVQVWSAYNFIPGGKPGPVLLGSTSSGRSVVAKGDWSSAEIWAGERYEFRYRFSRFKSMQEIGGGKAVRNVIRTQVRQAKLAYHESGFFQAMVMPENRKPCTYTYDGTVLGVRSSSVGNPPTMPADVQRYYEGVFNIPIMGRGDRVLVELRNDTPHPSKFSTLEWIGGISSRSGAG